MPDMRRIADQSRRAVSARSNTGIVGSKLTQGIDVSVRLLCACVVLRVGSSLAYRLCTGLRN
jgi:hypothetical protein